MLDLNALCEKDEALAHLVWKARHQRKLTDEQILYFLERCSRWDMLPHYSAYLKRIKDEKLALEQLRKDYSLSGTGA